MNIDDKPGQPSEISRNETHIGLLRHGITLWNEEKRIQGSLDSPLSPHGRRVTARWAEQLQYQGWNRIIASDLGRVQETVTILNETLHLPIHFDERLRELHWGKWEGISMLELNRVHGAYINELTNQGWDFRPPGGESRREAGARAHHALLAAIQSWPGEKILVVCHMGIIKCLICHITDSSFLPGDTPAIGKEAMHLLSAVNQQLNCRRLNINLPAES